MNALKYDKEVILAEYASVRSEIQQFNGQVFSVLCSSLALNIAVLGWLIGKSNPLQFYLLPTLGIFLLLMGDVMLLNRNRLAHRLALFQKHFIESRLPDFCWSRVYFEYRNRYPKNLLVKLSERLADSAAFILLFAGIINLFVLIILGLIPVFKRESVTIDGPQIANFVMAVVLVGLQDVFRRLFTNYKIVDKTLEELANERGLINRPSNATDASPPDKDKEG